MGQPNPKPMRPAYITHVTEYTSIFNQGIGLPLDVFPSCLLVFPPAMHHQRRLRKPACPCPPPGPPPPLFKLHVHSPCTVEPSGDSKPGHTHLLCPAPHDQQHRCQPPPTFHCERCTNA
ncbi:hypothetical protein CIPAW_10G093400 [Carya illinoinensis]|uniref:Uncharacterized protein n=1 Tax=Carya illinoinensis TaxID=32201 RepID=A0A8T1P495_CARIL|nr:hypothetical protein CIPAW_10G093400 [Carya illinoinensis]